MTDVLPSCIGMEELLYLLFSGFVQANKSHAVESFQWVRINPSGGAKETEVFSDMNSVSNKAALTQAVGA